MVKDYPKDQEHRLTLLRAAECMHHLAQATRNRARVVHPVAADLRAARDALLAGRDLVHTYDCARPPAGVDPLWASALTSRPVAAALMGSTRLSLRSRLPGCYPCSPR